MPASCARRSEYLQAQPDPELGTLDDFGCAAGQVPCAQQYPLRGSLQAWRGRAPAAMRSSETIIGGRTMIKAQKARQQPKATGSDKRVALYLRVSTGGQTTANQRREFAAVAKRHAWNVVNVSLITAQTPRIARIGLASTRCQRPSCGARLIWWRLGQSIASAGHSRT
jgi:hypothetical protein